MLATILQAGNAVHPMPYTKSDCWLLRETVHWRHSQNVTVNSTDHDNALIPSSHEQSPTTPTKRASTSAAWWPHVKCCGQLSSEFR
eukprot:1335996-Amphidinium_carterae.5